MSGHHDFDHAMQEGNLWLSQVADQLHFKQEDRHAYSALLAVLHALRDLLSLELAVHLSAQLPMVVRGLFFEGWKMQRTLGETRTVEGFCEHVEHELPPKFPMDGKTVSVGIFEVLWTRLDVGETAKIIDQMPTALKSLWPQVARRG